MSQANDQGEASVGARSEDTRERAQEPRQAGGQAPAAAMRLLVSTDFSADAVCAGRRAVALAHLLGASVELLHVLRKGALAAWGARPDADEIGARLRLAAQDALTRQAEALGSAVATSLLEGDVVAAVGARAEAADLLVLGAHGQHRLRDAALGSTGDRLVRRSTRPVLVVRCESDASPASRAPAVTAPHVGGESARPVSGPWRRVLVAADFSEHSLAALRWAGRLAAGAIELLHVYELPFEGKLRQAGFGEAELVRLRAQARAAALRRLHAMRADAGLDREAEVGVLEGYPPQCIVEHAAATRADLVVIGKHGESALEDLVLGSAALHVLARSPCDVLVVRGPGERADRAAAGPTTG